MGAPHEMKSIDAITFDQLDPRPHISMQFDVLPRQLGGGILISIEPAEPVENPVYRDDDVCAKCVGTLLSDATFKKVMAGQGYGTVRFDDLQSLNMFIVWYAAHHRGGSDA